MSTPIYPMVVDLSHHNTVTSWDKVKAAKIQGVIHKATEGRGFVDALYNIRRPRVLERGMLWGAYHFFRPGDVKAQVQFFLAHAMPDANTLLALDHEDPAVPLANVLTFLHMLEDKVGRQAVLYSGFLIKEQAPATNAYLASHRLWLAQYAANPVTPRLWAKPWLWQFTGDGHGPYPHAIPGIMGSGIDINSYDRGVEQLAKEWPGVTAGAVVAGNTEPGIAVTGATLTAGASDETH